MSDSRILNKELMLLAQSAKIIFPPPQCVPQLSLPSSCLRTKLQWLRYQIEHQTGFVLLVANA